MRMYDVPIKIYSIKIFGNNENSLDHGYYTISVVQCTNNRIPTKYFETLNIMD